MTGEEQSQPSSEASVGQQLRRAREKLGLSVSDIADQQHLRPSVIQSIEEGDYSKIDTELFLKGYVRTYARQVKLDADAVIATLDLELEPLRQQRELEQQANPLVDIERRKKRKRQIAKLVVLLLLLGLAGFLVYSYLAKPLVEPVSNSAGEITGPAETTEDTSDANVMLDDDSTVIAASEQTGEPDSADSETRSIDDTETANLSVVESESPIVPADNESALQEDVASEQSSLGLDETPVDEQSPEPALNGPEVVEEAPDGNARLAMTFNDDCWIQVSDVAGNRLVSALHRQGDVLDVRGQPPLKVVVGAMSSVESLEFQGEVMDLSHFRVVNNRSEFTLEP